MIDRDQGSKLPSFGKPLREMTGPYRAQNPVLVGALKVLDLIGRIHSKQQGQLPLGRPIRVLVANWGHLGDVVTILPLLQLLKANPRVGRLGLLIGSWSRPVVSGMKGVDAVHNLDHWAMVRASRSRLQKIITYREQKQKVIRDIIKEQYDISIDLFSTFPSTHRVMWDARIPTRIGFASSGLGTYLTHAHQWQKSDQYILDKQLGLLVEILGAHTPTSLPPSYPDFSPNITAIEELRLNRKYVVMHLGAGDKQRSWILEKWLSLASALEGRGWHIILTGAAGAEAELAGVVAREVGVQNVAGMLSWDQFVTVIAQSALVISVETVTVHLAACFGIPTVALMAGRNEARLWHPNVATFKPVMHPVGCAPCHRARGCDAMACVRLITVEDVLSNLDNLLFAQRIQER